MVRNERFLNGKKLDGKNGWVFGRGVLEDVRGGGMGGGVVR